MSTNDSSKQDNPHSSNADQQASGEHSAPKTRKRTNLSKPLGTTHPFGDIRRSTPKKPSNPTPTEKKPASAESAGPQPSVPPIRPTSPSVAASQPPRTTSRFDRGDARPQQPSQAGIRSRNASGVFVDNVSQDTGHRPDSKFADFAPPPRKPSAPRRTLDVSFENARLLILLTIMVPLTLFAYWPGLYSMVVEVWWKHVDYGHGFFVIPLVVMFLYLRLDDYPGTKKELTWIGLLPLVLCFLMRYQSAQQSMNTLDLWSIFFWTTGIVWLFYGTRVLVWALPSLLFLWFMFPLPFSFDVFLRQEMQRLAAQLAATLLFFFAEPAMASGNTIRLSSALLEVERACSGLRFLISILCWACCVVLLMRRPWWQNAIVLISAIPLALFVNASRIAITGMLIVRYSFLVKPFVKTSAFPVEAANDPLQYDLLFQKQLSIVADEMSGYAMIVVAIGIFVAGLWFLGKVFRRVDIT